VDSFSRCGIVVYSNFFSNESTGSYHQRRACQRVSHRNCTTRSTSGLVRDPKSNRHTFGTCCPLMMPTIQECMPCSNQMMKEAGRANQRLTTLPLLSCPTCSHCHHLYEVIYNLCSHLPWQVKVSLRDHHLHLREHLHHLHKQVQEVLRATHLQGEALFLQALPKFLSTFLAVMLLNSALGNVQGTLECGGNRSPATMS
jgi:hypothetical protein